MTFLLMRAVRPQHRQRLPAGAQALGLVLGFVLCAMALPAQAQWQWRDATGRVNVSDRPPPAGVADKDILQRPAGTSPRPGAAPARAPAASPAASAPGDATARVARGEPELDARKRRAEEEAAAKKKADEQAEAANRKAEDQRNAAARADNCQRAQGALRAVEDGQRIARTNARGEREFLDDAQRAAEAQRLRTVVASDCK